jgi:hypothetical protein
MRGKYARIYIHTEEKTHLRDSIKYKYRFEAWAIKYDRVWEWVLSCTEVNEIERELREIYLLQQVAAILVIWNMKG